MTTPDTPEPAPGHAPAPSPAAPAARRNAEARAAVLGRIRRALSDVPGASDPGPVPATVPVERPYSHAGPEAPGSPEALRLLEDRLVDYKATVRTVADDAVAGAIAESLAARGAARVVLPEGFPEHWRPEPSPGAVPGPAPRLLPDGDPPLTVTELDAVDGVVTTAVTAIAATGTLVLDGGPGQGRRALTLVPDHHLCVIRADQVVASVPEAMARLDPARPLTFISGPSATSDIELRRVEGVHGPRTLEVLLVTG
ncbi:lactate utilization protein C [Streptomyces xinghaiensis]|uniref:lactate utilization protein C n=1 Tax=Streptomyces xinghaiensis TaxID=1038928 RepID=UPI0037BB941C